MEKDKREKISWVKVKKEAWLSAQEVEKFDSERRKNLTETS